MGWIEDKFYDLMEQPITKDQRKPQKPIKNPKPFFGFLNMVVFGLFLLWVLL